MRVQHLLGGKGTREWHDQDLWECDAEFDVEQQQVHLGGQLASRPAQDARAGRAVAVAGLPGEVHRPFEPARERVVPREDPELERHRHYDRGAGDQQRWASQGSHAGLRRNNGWSEEAHDQQDHRADHGDILVRVGAGAEVGLEAAAPLGIAQPQPQEAQGFTRSARGTAPAEERPRLHPQDEGTGTVGGHLEQHNWWSEPARPGVVQTLLRPEQEPVGPAGHHPVD